jgi:hypothetical protein
MPFRHARRRSFRVALLLPSLLFATLRCAPVTGESPEQRAVRAAFHSYRRAVTVRDGSEAAKHVSRATRAYYAGLRPIALHGTAEQLRAERLATRLRIVTLRHRVPLQRLLVLADEELLAYALARGWLEQRVVAESVGRIEVRGDGAYGERKAPGRPDGGVTFAKQDGAWRIDLVAGFDEEEAELRQLAREQGVGEDELVLALVQAATRTEVPRSIWDPLADFPPGEPLRDVWPPAAPGSP